VAAPEASTWADGSRGAVTSSPRSSIRRAEAISRFFHLSSCATQLLKLLIVVAWMRWTIHRSSRKRRNPTRTGSTTSRRRPSTSRSACRDARRRRSSADTTSNASMRSLQRKEFGLTPSSSRDGRAATSHARWDSLVKLLRWVVACVVERSRCLVHLQWAVDQHNAASLVP